MENPFKYGGIVRGPYFANRRNEMNELKREMLNLNRVFLVSPRRFGKTCLLFNLIEMLERETMACAYIDLNAFPDIKSFATALTGFTVRALETNKDKLLRMLAGFQKLRPKVSVDPDGNITAGLELAVAEKDALSALLEGLRHTEKLAAKKKKKLVIIIDEFSDLDKFNGQTIEKALRSEIQKQTHIGYIFSGSEQSTMLAMARDRTRAFYKLGRIMELGRTKDVITDPHHPYAQALIAAVPIPDPAYKRPIPKIKGEVAQPIDPPPGCRFQTRCLQVMDVCRDTQPQLKEVKPGHAVACHLY